MRCGITGSNRRIDLDIAKGIGAILVVWAHIDGVFSEYINQFHMPLFFFISGILFSKNKEKSGSYVRRKIKAYLIPFWKYNFMFFPIFFLLYYRNDYELKIALKWLGEILFTVNKVPFLGATWFLASLFWICIFYKLIYDFLERFPKRDLILWGGAFIVLIVGLCTNLPYRQSRTLICSFFYVAGYLYEKYLSIRIKENSLLAGMSLLFFCIEARYNYVYLGSGEIKNKLMFVLGALAMTFFILFFSNKLRKCKLLLTKIIVMIGEHSLDLLVWQFLAFRIAICIQIVVLGLETKALIAFPVYDSKGIWFVLYLLCGVYGSIMCQKIFDYFECLIRSRGWRKMERNCNRYNI